MDARTARPRDRLAEPGARQILLVAPVAGFVHRAPEATDKAIFTIARGEAGILGHAAAKRMGTFIQAPSRKVETE